MFYEGVLLFGLLMIGGLIFSIVTGQTHALRGQLRMQVFLFVLLGTYFVYCWTHGGQTLAMKTWSIRLVSASGEPVGLFRATARYLLAWLWFIPALATAWAIGWNNSSQLYGLVAMGAAIYSVISFVLPGRQFLHDWLCGTRLLPFPPNATKALSGHS